MNVYKEIMHQILSWTRASLYCNLTPDHRQDMYNIIVSTKKKHVSQYKLKHYFLVIIALKSTLKHMQDIC